MRQAHRFAGPGKPYDGLTVLRPKDAKRPGVDWSGRVHFIADSLDEPLSWRKPQRVFVNSMSDLFHESLEREQVAAVFGVMAAAPQHTFQVLTKRPTSASTWFHWAKEQAHPDGGPGPASLCGVMAANYGADVDWLGLPETWPLPNVWLGVSVEDRAAKYRIDELRDLPAAVRFLSCEPLLEDLGELDLRGIDWVIVGGESGAGARPCALEWLERIVEQCCAANVACFVKQLGAFVVSELHACATAEEAQRDFGFKSRWLWRMGTADRKGGDIAEFPDELKVRQFPR